VDSEAVAPAAAVDDGDVCRAARFSSRAAEGVLDTLDSATLDGCEEEDCIEPTTRLAFGEIDSDYCPSERDDCSEDDVEYDGEAEVS
jgi:hypothetical protein